MIYPLKVPDYEAYNSLSLQKVYLMWNEFVSILGLILGY